MPRVKTSSIETILNADGGILEQRQNLTLSWGEEPAYIKMYLKDIMYLHDVPKKYAALTSALLRRMSYAGEEHGMCVILAPIVKQEICREMGWQRVTSLNNALQKLLTGKILYRVDRSVFKFNPYLFGKGEWQDVARLRMEIDYNDIQGRTFKVNVEHKSPSEPPEKKGQKVTDISKAKKTQGGKKPRAKKEKTA
jgi:hypothetical protein